MLPEPEALSGQHRTEVEKTKQAARTTGGSSRKDRGVFLERERTCRKLGLEGAWERIQPNVPALHLGKGSEKYKTKQTGRWGLVLHSTFSAMPNAGKSITDTNQWAGLGPALAHTEL